jgi:hypothetical protein
MLLFIYNLWSYCVGLRGPVLNFVQGLGFVRDGPAMTLPERAAEEVVGPGRGGATMAMVAVGEGKEEGAAAVDPTAPHQGGGQRRRRDHASTFTFSYN